MAEGVLNSPSLLATARASKLESRQESDEYDDRDSDAARGMMLGHEAGGILHRHVVAGKGHHAGAQFQVQAMKRGVKQVLNLAGGHAALRSSGAGPVKARNMVHTMDGPCCPLYLRDSPRYGVCSFGGPQILGPLSSKATPIPHGRFVSPLCLSVWLQPAPSAVPRGNSLLTSGLYLPD